MRSANLVELVARSARVGVVIGVDQTPVFDRFAYHKARDAAQEALFEHDFIGASVQGNGVGGQVQMPIGLFGVFEFVAGGSGCGEESSGREPEDSDLVDIDVPLFGVCPDRADGSSDVGLHGLDAIEVACGPGGAELEYDSDDVVRGEESSEVVAFLVDHDPRQSTPRADDDCCQRVSCPSVGPVDGQGGAMDVVDAAVDDRLAVASFDNRLTFGDAFGSGWCVGPERDGESFGVCVSGRACE